MNRTIGLSVGAVLLFAFGAFVANTNIAQGVIPVTAYEADVNKDARVNVADLGHVASRYGQPVPTATPMATTPVVIGDRAFSNGDLIRTSDGSLVASFPGFSHFSDFGPEYAHSCDGSKALLVRNTYPDGVETTDIILVNTVDGSVLVTSSLETYSGRVFVLFPCPLSRGGTLTGGQATPSRAIVVYRTPVVSGFTDMVLVYNLASGEVIHSAEVGSGMPDYVWLTCTQDRLIYRLPGAGGDERIVSLADGSTVSQRPFIRPTC